MEEIDVFGARGILLWFFFLQNLQIIGPWTYVHV